MQNSSESPSPMNAGGGPHVSSSRFNCRVTVEDICLTVEKGDDKYVQSVWEELRVNCEFNGLTISTRWLPAPIALKKVKDKEARREEQAVDPTVEQEDTQEAQHFSMSRRRVASGAKSTNDTSVTSTGADRLTDALDDMAGLYFSKFNDASYSVQFTSDPEREAACTARDYEEDADRPAGRRFVRPKRVHHMHLSVEAQNADRLFSATGGVRGDEKPSSANKDALVTAYKKKASKFSSWTRSVFQKFSAADPEKEKEADGEAQRKALNDYLQQRQTDDGKSGSAAVYKGRGSYSPVIASVDFSEAYNAPGGRKRFHLVLKRDSSRFPSNGEGVPVILSFTVRAHYAEPREVKVTRSYHNFVIVVDQVTLDLTKADATQSIPGDGALRPRVITGYGFGAASDMSNYRSGDTPAPAVSSRILPMNLSKLQLVSGERPTTVIDFASQHRTDDETQLTAEDYAQIPSSMCIVSSACKVGNKDRIGNRAVLFSRFKTSANGLCKPSYKCQLALFLKRQLDGTAVEVECARIPIDLAAILNAEYFRPLIRQVSFSLGELVYVRLRRFCFLDPELYRAPLLQPYDSVTVDVPIHTGVEPVATWVRPGRRTQQQPEQPHSGQVEQAEDTASTTSSSSTSPSVDPNNPFLPSTAARTNDTGTGNTAQPAEADPLFNDKNIFAPSQSKQRNTTAVKEPALDQYYDPHEMFSHNPRAQQAPSSATATPSAAPHTREGASMFAESTVNNRRTQQQAPANDFTVSPSRDDYYQNLFAGGAESQVRQRPDSAAQPLPSQDSYYANMFSNGSAPSAAAREPETQSSNLFNFSGGGEPSTDDGQVVTFEITPLDGQRKS